MRARAATANEPPAWLGRTFLHPVIDYLAIGGLLSLTLAVVIVATGETALLPIAAVHALVLFSNSAHFASSTVRLYCKPVARETWPLVTTLLPAATLVAVGLCLAFADLLGRHATALYLTWSPYHYAAQAYGLAVMYAYRSGCRLGARDKHVLKAVALLPFVHALFVGRGVGADWLLPEAWQANETYQAAVAWLRHGLPVIAVVAIAAAVVEIRRSTGRMLPLISLLTIVSNGVWFFVLAPLQAFLWATIFHGLQYLVIVAVFHTRDQLARPDNRRPGWQHALGFYATSLLLGYLLFQCVPLGFVAAGFGPVESVLITVAAINVHHFIVDGFIWKLRRDAGNRRTVEAAT